MSTDSFAERLRKVANSAIFQNGPTVQALRIAADEIEDQEDRIKRLEQELKRYDESSR